jgi:hypothetical protein
MPTQCGAGGRARVRSYKGVLPVSCETIAPLANRHAAGYVRCMHFAATNNRNANNRTPTRRVGD